MTLDEFFAGQEESRVIFESLRDVMLSVGVAELRVTKSQVAFRRRQVFAYAWIPGRYLRGKNAPLVLTLALRRHDPSSRWKEIVEPNPGRFIHHLELLSTAEIDDELRAWLREAWAEAS